MRLRPLLFATVLLVLPVFVTAADGDEAAISGVLRHFLAKVDEKATHESFWADDLIYTTSSGLRYGKSTIIERFEDGEAEERYRTTYGATDVTIRVFGDLAVLTFRLTADEDGERVSEYLNTGVLRRVNESDWQAFTWQATVATD